ncbi:MAG: hypothetical protein CL955_08590 [Erythrobacteraceae bacterium]|jgi:hypothetical protein|nr:hypothetical protein [Erythrobacteraceae bacterium]
MRKFFVLVAAFGALVAQPAVSVAERVRTDIGRIKNVTPGGIEVIRSGQSRTANSGFRLNEGDIVVTKRNQRVGITLADNTRLAIAPRSRVIISTYLFDRDTREGEARISLERGRMGVDSGDLTEGERIRFRAGSSTLGVRGTHFIMEVDD